MNNIKIYCAGPLFNNKEREEMQEIADVLEEKNFDVFYHTGMGLNLQIYQIILNHLYKLKKKLIYYCKKQYLH